MATATEALAVLLPDRLLNDNGVVFWPPTEFDLWTFECWPAIAEAWEKWEHDYERIAHRRWQRQVRCHGRKLVGVDRAGRSMWGRCGEVFLGSGAWRDHCLAEHGGRGVQGSWANQRWTWEMLGFGDHWDGKPTGWRNVLDGRDPTIKAWEADALELGSHVADHFWNQEAA